MKLLIASDIHGSATWCRRLMDAVSRETPDRIVLLGDVLYHGPRNDLPEGYAPKEVAAMLNGVAESIVAVRGNCDAEVDQMVLDFPCMADYATLFDGDTTLFCTHGHVWSPERMPLLPSGAAFLSGHTHVKVNEDVSMRVCDGVLVPARGEDVGVAGGDVRTIHLVNPGSVSIPKDGSHSFALYENGEFELVQW